LRVRINIEFFLAHWYIKLHTTALSEWRLSLQVHTIELSSPVPGNEMPRLASSDLTFATDSLNSSDFPVSIQVRPMSGMNFCSSGSVIRSTIFLLLLGEQLTWLSLSTHFPLGVGYSISISSDFRDCYVIINWQLDGTSINVTLCLWYSTS